MELFNFLLLVGLAALFFYIGKTYSTNNGIPRSTPPRGYSHANQGDDEENELPLVSSTTKHTSRTSSEADSKQIDKLMRDIEEIKNREKKHLAQIQLLKSKLDNASKVTEKPTPQENTPTRDEHADDDVNNLMNQELEDLIGGKNFDSNEPLDEDQLSREIEQEMQNKALI
eukprot:CAMPEP_0176462464 /NCGR_PEP_ID=MMETSP0127-20121128/35286_1 /TAXON_ID=938130 /ORGANISM="Platyophrya macrostoma, Strain WH" /LENGTH=170 /DNA_ID=CAMNT_0017854393 /DNA_START=24 /DNA_END=536 /DNA_ORIENTATION=-